jgi:hypothetical protein
MNDKKQLQEAVSRGLAVSRKNEMAKQLDAMRRELAVRPEERIVDFACAYSGAPFHVRFSRTSPAERFAVAAIVRGGQPRQNSQMPSTWPGSASAPSASFDIAEFDLSGWECPWCQASKMTKPHSFVHCGDCGDLVCTGRSSVLPNGKCWFSCQPRCGKESVTGPRLTRLGASEQRGQTSLPKAPSTPKLSTNAAPRLSGPRK